MNNDDKRLEDLGVKWWVGLFIFLIGGAVVAWLCGFTLLAAGLAFPTFIAVIACVYRYVFMAGDQRTPDRD